MVTMIAQLCALCAMCSLLQNAAPEEASGGVRMTGGLLMLHLVVSGAQSLCRQALEAGSLMRIFDVLMK